MEQLSYLRFQYRRVIDETMCTTTVHRSKFLNAIQPRENQLN